MPRRNAESSEYRVWIAPVRHRRRTGPERPVGFSRPWSANDYVVRPHPHIDRRKRAVRGVDRAVELADRFGATVRTLYVVDQANRAGDWDIVERQEAEGESATAAAERADAVGTGSTGSDTPAAPPSG